MIWVKIPLETSFDLLSFDSTASMSCPWDVTINIVAKVTYDMSLYIYVNDYNRKRSFSIALQKIWMSLLDEKYCSLFSKTCL